MSVDKEDKEGAAASEQIFLLELVIQKVFIDVIESADLAFYTAETCLSYKFLGYGPFKICEKDFKSKVEAGCCAGCNSLRNGNSTMLPMFPEQIDKLKAEGFEIEVEIIKMFKTIPETIGTTTVPMIQIFQSVLDGMTKKKTTTASKSMKNRYKLKNEEGDPVGYVDLFIRLSCMGKMIITKFQMDTDRECIEFQSNTGNSYTYQKNVFPDPFICRPCGKPALQFPAYKKASELPKSFPEFKVTDAMKTRLQERRNQELGISQPGSKRSSKSKNPKNVNKQTDPKPPPEPVPEEAEEE